jgi:hypothetical protein
MNAYVITVEDRPGIAHKLLDAAGKRNVNVAPFYGLSDGSTGLICLGSDDEEGLRAAIADAGYAATAFELVVVELENKPGVGAALSQKLVDAGVDLRVVTPVGMSGDRIQMGFGSTDTALLKRTLGA